MKKLIRTVLLLLIILALLISLFPLSYLIRNDNNNRENICGFYAEQENSLEMIYIGGSAAYVYWEPLRAWDRSGIPSYVLGQDTLPPQSIKYYIIEAQKTQKPELFVVDLRPFQYGDTLGYNETAVRNGTDSFSYSINRFNMINASVPVLKDRLTYYFDIFKYNSRWPYIFFNLMQALQRHDFSWFDYADNIRTNSEKGFGFVFKQQDVSLEDFTNISGEMPLNDEINNIFIELLDYCGKQNIKVLFIVHVYNQKMADKQMYNYMAKVIDEYGFDYINMNDYVDEIGIDSKTDFLNADHVNILGADKYTDYLTDYIIGKYDMKDMRGNIIYAEWNQLSCAFADKAEKARETIRNIINDPHTQDIESEDWWLEIP